MHVAVLQFSAGRLPAQNRATIADGLSQLEIGTHDLVVLPEASMRDFGPPDDDLRVDAEPLGADFSHLLATESARLGTTIIAGMFERSDDLPFNTLLAADPDGNVETAYRKIHLYDSFGYKESERMAAGPITPTVIDIGTTRIGLMTCYDIRFPELARALVDKGADVLVIPTAWVAGENKLDHWRTLVKARAIENTVDVVAAAQCGRHYTGHSLVVSASGTVVAEADNDPEIFTVSLSGDARRQARQRNPSLANRRMGQ